MTDSDVGGPPERAGHYDLSGVRIWPDDFSEDELVEDAVYNVVVGVLEDAPLDFCVEYEVRSLGLEDRADEIRQKARRKLEVRGIDG